MGCRQPVFVDGEEAIREFYKILIGINVITLMIVSIVLSTPLANTTVDFEWSFIILGLMIVPIGLVFLIKFCYDIKLYYDIKHFDD